MALRNKTAAKLAASTTLSAQPGPRFPTVWTSQAAAIEDMMMFGTGFWMQPAAVQPPTAMEWLAQSFTWRPVTGEDWWMPQTRKEPETAFGRLVRDLMRQPQMGDQLTLPTREDWIQQRQEWMLQPWQKLVDRWVQYPDYLSMPGREISGMELNSAMLDLVCQIMNEDPS